VDRLRKAKVNIELTEDFQSMIPKADAIYMTRVQDEWDDKKGESKKIDISRYCFGVEHLKRLKPHAVILHPFPRRNEISPEVDHDPRAVYWRQMRNGMWVRVALIAGIFGRDREIHDYYQTHQ